MPPNQPSVETNYESMRESNVWLISTKFKINIELLTKKCLKRFEEKSIFPFCFLKAYGSLRLRKKENVDKA